MFDIRPIIHSAINVEVGGKSLYFDPFHLTDSKSKLSMALDSADIVLITHDHYDHFSPLDIKLILKEDTKIVMPSSMKAIYEDSIINELIDYSNVYYVKPNDSIQIGDISILAVPSYNVGKTFHISDKKYVGYIVSNNGESIYVAGDTDINDDNINIKCDIALLPVGGTYTMNSTEAAKLANTIRPKIVYATHYGDIVGVSGADGDGEAFKKLVDKDIEVILPY